MTDTTKQTISWFWDIAQRGLLDLEPAYQRRSVWSRRYQAEFIDTITLAYPCPELFLFAEITPAGVTVYHVVDGKQRLTAIFSFLNNDFPMADDATVVDLRNKYFEQFSPDQKKQIWAYTLSVVLLNTADETVLESIFNRFNKNVARLTRQELRHAKFNGVFISSIEELSDWFNHESPDLPRIAETSKKQMRDVELVATLCLLLEEGVKSYSADDLDAAFSARDDDWPQHRDIDTEFRAVVAKINEISGLPGGEIIRQSRLRNIVDYYSLFGAVAEILREGGFEDIPASIARLRTFVQTVEAAENLAGREAEYYDAARSATNDVGPRTRRISIIKDVLLGRPLAPARP